MKIAIHPIKKSFSDWWIQYCIEHEIDYKLVNCYDSNIISQLKGCDALMWHFHHANAKDYLMAKQLLLAVSLTGLKVFPDFNTVWHFDDKIAQKYLLESIGAPLAPTFVFYSKNDALNWIKQTSFPKVFKLRGGAGAVNVELVKSENQAGKLVNIAFGRGFKHNSLIPLSETWSKYKQNQINLTTLAKAVLRQFVETEFSKTYGRAKSYVYFQDFISGNSFDTRIYVINNKAFATIRYNRKNDFRASGSGLKSLDPNLVSKEAIIEAFKISERLSLQCCAYDFVMKEDKPYLLEISYGFGERENKGGYWDRDLVWHEGRFNPYGWMVDEVLRQE